MKLFGDFDLVGDLISDGSDEGKVKKLLDAYENPKNEKQRKEAFKKITRLTLVLIAREKLGVNNG